MHVWVDNWADWADIPALFIDLRETKSEGLRLAQTLAGAGNLVICLVNYGSSWTIGSSRKKTAKKVAGHDEDQIVSTLTYADTALFDLDWDVMVLDEIHKIKSPSSKVSLFFRNKVAPKCKERIGLTGSLIKKRPGDAWAPVKFVTGSEVFPGPYVGSVDTYAQSFCGRYAIPHPYIRGAVAGWQNLEDFAKRLAICAYVVDLEDCMDLPPQIHTWRKVDLSTKSRKVYDDVTKNLYAELETIEADGRKVYVQLIEWLERHLPKRVQLSDWQMTTASDHYFFRKDVQRDAEKFVRELFNSGFLAFEKDDLIEKLRSHALSVQIVTVNHIFSVMRKQTQITSGYVLPDRDEDDPEKEVVPVALGSEKVEAMVEYLEALWPNPTVIIVTSNYEEKLVAEAIKKHFTWNDAPFTPKILNGQVKGAKVRHELIASGAKDPCFILKAQVGAESIDCRWAKTFILMSVTPDTIQYDQLLARNHRGGQTETCTYVHILANRTVDERIAEIIAGDLDLARKTEKNWRELLVFK
jgi:SNF2 family DNA or RNA helicase